MSRCANAAVPRGQTCPTCGEQHSQPRARIGSGLILVGVLVLLGGFGYYAWTHRDGGYGGYDYGAW